MLTNTNGKPERAAVYCRVSSEEQAQAGTIENQVEFARRYTELHQIPVHDVYLDDGVSGTLPLDQRPGSSRLMEDARASKFNVVLIYKLDRFARRQRVLLDGFETLNALDIGLRSMTESFDTATAIGRLFMQMMGSFAEYEREAILERTSLGKQRAARDGRWTGGMAPFGYRIVDKHMTVDPAQAAVVRRIFDLYVHESMGTIAIAELLNAEEVPTAFCAQNRGRQYKWNIGVLSRILRNTAYIGRYVAGKRVGKLIAEYEVPAIVDEATFQTAKPLLRKKMQDAKRNAHRTYLLRSLIRCHCGYVAIGRGSHSDRIYHYSCPHGHFKLRAELLEKKVWDDVAAFAGDPGDVIEQLREVLRGRATATEDVAQQVAYVAKQIATKQLEQDGIITLYRRGRITEVQLDRQLDDLVRETAALEARQQVLFGQQVEAQSREAAMITAEEMLPQLRERVAAIERDAASKDLETAARALEAKRELIKDLVDGIEVDQEGVVTIRYVFVDYSVHVKDLVEVR